VGQWLAARKERAAGDRSGDSGSTRGGSGERQPTSAASTPSRPKKLGYHDQREWEGIEAAVLTAEERLKAAEEALADPAVATDASRLQKRIAEAKEAREEVDRLYARWAELEEKRG
jgi:ATP-binding cassette subfamily F protein uup